MPSAADAASIDLCIVGSPGALGNHLWFSSVVTVDFLLYTFPKVSTLGSLYHQYFSEHHSHFSGFIPLFSDRSKSGDVVGSAFVCANEVLARWLPSVMTVFMAEIHGIHLSLHHVQSKADYHAMVHVIL